MNCKFKTSISIIIVLLLALFILYNTGLNAYRYTMLYKITDEKNVTLLYTIAMRGMNLSSNHLCLAAIRSTENTVQKSQAVIEDIQFPKSSKYENCL